MAKSYGSTDPNRINSVDVMRGIVIILMTLGHSRHFFLHYDFAPTNVDFTTPGLFFTRWITNICAPVFVFLAGTSIYLVNVRSNSRKYISTVLIKRGLWLIFLEITLLTFFWHTHFDTIQLQVIWVIGLSFLFMSALVYVPRKILLFTSLGILLLHNLLDLINIENVSGFWRVFLTFLHVPGDISFGNRLTINVLYSFFPYIGLMMFGYAMGPVFYLEQRKRDRILILLGSLMVAGFILLRFLNVYGDPVPWMKSERGPLYSVMSFLNVNKYPPSLLYILSTLGPAFILLTLMEEIRNRWIEGFRKIGQVAMFFYVFHIPFIRVCAKIYSTLFHENPPLIVFYLIWIGMMIVLYQISILYRDYKLKRKNKAGFWWLKYM